MTISKAAASEQNPGGRNAFTCRTCPYQFVLDQPYYERTYMKQKQKDDILGEDQTDLPINEGKTLALSRGPNSPLKSSWWLSEREVQFETGILLSVADPERRRASYIVLQGMLAWAVPRCRGSEANASSVRRMFQAMARVLSSHEPRGHSCIREKAWIQRRPQVCSQMRRVLHCAKAH